MSQSRKPMKTVAQTPLISKKRSLMITALFVTVIFIMLIANYISYNSYEQKEIQNVIPFNGLIFLLIGLTLIGVSCFTFLQLAHYQTGKSFAIYVLLLGLAISLTPCNKLNDPIITVIRMACVYVSSILFYQIIGRLALLTSRLLFKILRTILVIVVLVSLTMQILSSFFAEALWVRTIASGSINGCVFFAALFSLIVMISNYKTSNPYTKKQTKILTGGIGAGAMLFMIVSFFPNIYLVQIQDEIPQAIENPYWAKMSFIPQKTILTEIPLIILSGVSIAIIFMLLHREFVLSDVRLKLKYFLIAPPYFLIPNVLLLAYVQCPLWILATINLFLSLPLFLGVNQIFSVSIDSDEQTYQWRLLQEIENEKEKLSSYLHDEVLQSLIAFYRQVQADNTQQYSNMKEPLSHLISEIRRVSHNLYPTMVEDLGLEQSLQIFAGELQKKYPDVEISIQYEFENGILPQSLSLAFYRIVKELITNAEKHAQASRIFCVMTEDNGGYYIHVNDNGKGFSIPDNDELLQSPHMGLYTVKKRILGLKGQIDFQSIPQKGTEYNICFSKEALQIEP